ncbi:ALP1-like protein isoform X1 [Tanacetum coccineum]
MSYSTDGMFDLDDIDDIEMIMQQLRYEQSLQEQEAGSSNRRNYIYCERDIAKERLMADYFGDNPKYPAVRRDATAQPSFSVIMKCTSAIRQLAYIITPDAFDEYLQARNGTGNLREVIKKYPAILVEAVAYNDISVLNNSPLFDDLIDDIAPVAPFKVNGVTFQQGYYLANEIYP